MSAAVGKDALTRAEAEREITGRTEAVLNGAPGAAAVVNAALPAAETAALAQKLEELVAACEDSRFTVRAERGAVRFFLSGSPDFLSRALALFGEKAK